MLSSFLKSQSWRVYVVTNDNIKDTIWWWFDRQLIMIVQMEAVPHPINPLQPVDERKWVIRRRCACKKVSDAKVRKIDKGEQWEYYARVFFLPYPFWGSVFIYVCLQFLSSSRWWSFDGGFNLAW